MRSHSCIYVWRHSWKNLIVTLPLLETVSVLRRVFMLSWKRGVVGQQKQQRRNLRYSRKRWVFFSFDFFLWYQFSTCLVTCYCQAHFDKRKWQEKELTLLFSWISGQLSQHSNDDAKGPQRMMQLQKGLRALVLVGLHWKAHLAHSYTRYRQSGRLCIFSAEHRINSVKLMFCR